MSVGRESYRFGQKNNWRRWVWNQMGRRLAGLGVSARDALGLYLAGPEDLDRAIAIGKRFRPHNLIAVESDDSAISALRKQGVLVVASTLESAVKSWPVSRVPLRFVHADLCSCFTPAADGAFELAFDRLARSGGGVLSFNLLRGRETGAHATVARIYSESIGSPMHRGEALFVTSLARDFAVAVLGEQYIRPRGQEQLWELGGAHRENFLDFSTTMAESCEVEMRSYRSKTQTMDSIILTVPAGLEEGTIVGGDAPDTPTARSIAAVLAHRTRRAA